MARRRGFVPFPDEIHVELEAEPRQVGHVHNVRLRDELPDGEIFYTLAEAKIVVES